MTALEAGDYETAMKQFRSAAEEGHAGAQAALGELYNRGKGNPRDAQEAGRWYQLAAEQGNVDAQVTLGWMYNAGTGVPQNFTEAIKWFRLAADQGHPRRAKQFGCAVSSRERGDQNDVKNGCGVVPKSCRPGDGPCPICTRTNVFKWRRCRTKCCQKAVEWYTHAADQGLLEAQADLGFLYATREDKVPQDFLIAYKWLSLAAQKGDRIAKKDLEKLAATMTNNQIEEAKELVQKESS